MLVFAASSSSQNPLELLKPLWPLWVLVGLVLLGGMLRRLWEERQLRRAGIDEIDRVDGLTFERRLGRLFQELGYRVKHVGSAGGDYGSELLVSKDGTRTIVQAKCWRKKISLKAVQEVAAARPYWAQFQLASALAKRGFERRPATLTARFRRFRPDAVS